MTLRFAKMTGAGNDFIVFDNRQGQVPEPDPRWIAKLCSRRFSVGADGLMLLGPAAGPGLDFSMRYFNADGSEAAMCGNGGRCLARFAVLVNVGEEGRDLRFSSASGVYTARVEGSRVRLSLPAPARQQTGLRLVLSTGEREADSIDTGVPHAVFFTDAVEREDVKGLGREVRLHPAFAPQGTNVNFCQVLGPNRLSVRTYERGVEDETLACGTGVAAASLLAAARGLVRPPVAVLTRSGLELEMNFTAGPAGFSEITQRGEARLVYWAEAADEATAFTPPDRPAPACA
ncbi:MAG: diaminopimelate epimerase [candidate division FCPU426 bacterium]